MIHFYYYYIVFMIISNVLEYQDELSQKVSQDILKNLKNFKINIEHLNRIEQSRLPDFLELLKEKVLNKSIEISIGGKLCKFVNYHMESPIQESDVKRLKDFVNSFSRTKLLYRWDQRGAIILLRSDDTAEGSRLFFSMCLLYSPIEGVGYYVLLRITPTLCQTPRPDFILYCVETGLVFHWADIAALQNNKFYCVPDFPLPQEELEKIVHRFLDQRSIVYDHDRLTPRDVHDPSKR